MGKLCVVGLSGFMTSGKSEARKQVQRLTGYGTVKHMSFAAPLKDIAYKMGWDGNKDEAGRKLLQELGDFGKRHFGADCWVKALQRTLPKRGLVVIDDVRYLNEVALIKKLDGLLIRIERPGLVPDLTHSSESVLADYPFELVVVNDGTPEQLGDKVAHEIGKHFEVWL